MPRLSSFSQQSLTGLNNITLVLPVSITLDNPNPVDTVVQDQFGNSVSVSGNRAIVGAYLEDTAAGNNDGKAYIFDTTNGSLLHTLDNPNAFGASTTDRFGFSVDIDGDRAIVGAYLEDETDNSGSGKAYIFDVTDGSLLFTLDNPNEFGTSASDNFGFSVAISGDRAIVSADAEDETDNSGSGKAYIFDVTDGSLLFTLDNPADNQFGDGANNRFGRSVAISDDRAIVGAPFWNASSFTAPFQQGRAYIYDVTDGSLLFTLDDPVTVYTGNYFGSKVSIDGDRAIVGCPGFEAEGGDTVNSGRAYIFNVINGSLLHTLDNPNRFGTVNSDDFGSSVSISGDFAVVGAPGEDDSELVSGSASGKAYVFSAANGRLVHVIDNPNAFGESGGDQLGEAVAISGGTVFVGVSEEDESTGFGSGKTYVYRVPRG